MSLIPVAVIHFNKPRYVPSSYVFARSRFLFIDDYLQTCQNPSQQIILCRIPYQGRMLRLKSCTRPPSVPLPLEIAAQAALHMLDNKHRCRFLMAMGDDYVLQAGFRCGRNVIVATLSAGKECGTVSRGQTGEPIYCLRT